jgi:hypothetical protein
MTPKYYWPKMTAMTAHLLKVEFGFIGQSFSKSCQQPATKRSHCILILASNSRVGKD